LAAGCGGNQPDQNRLKNTNEELARLCARIVAFIREPNGGEARFNELALEVFDYQFRSNNPYRGYCIRAGAAPGQVTHWRQIPAIITSAFKEMDFTTLPEGQRTAVFHSSGTTQQRPGRHFHSRATLEVYEESLLAWFQPHVLPDANRMRFLILAPAPDQAPHSSLAHMFDVARSRFGTQDSCFLGTTTPSGWEVDFTTVPESDAPVVICGTAFSFVHWCDFLTARGRASSFPRGSRVFETGGYKGRSRAVPKAELHRLIEAKLGIPATHIISEYGMSELSSQAYDRVCGFEEERVFEFPPWVRATVISPETRLEVATGETGLVRVLDLANVGSVLAVQTEDLAVSRDRTGGHAGFELIGRAELAEPRGCSLLEVQS
jgi:hypothetical protein